MFYKFVADLRVNKNTWKYSISDYSSFCDVLYCNIGTEITVGPEDKYFAVPIPVDRILTAHEELNAEFGVTTTKTNYPVLDSLCQNTDMSSNPILFLFK